jgi:regulator of protease activity HflC (stomatin/prohibitin superfamily)
MRKLSLIVALACSACTWHSTDSNEVGVLTRKVALFGHPGVQDEVYAPGASYLFAAFITDWATYRTNTQNLELVADPARGDRKQRDDLEFKTHDGNDISVDVTVAWRIDPAKAPVLLRRVAGSTQAVKEKLVRPLVRSLVRDVLGTMTSEEFYVSEKRFQKAEEARERLASVAGPEGVIVERVLLGEHHFAKKYEDVIHDKKLAEQTAERMQSEGKAAEQEALAKLAGARGQVEQKIAKAKGALEQARLAADAELYKAKSTAEAIKAEKAARAQGVRKQNEALAGQGGRTLVKLRIAEALEGKQILFVPGGGKAGALQTTNVNDLLARFAGAAEVQRESKVEVQGEEH